MSVSFGQGLYQQQDESFKGDICLGEHKIFLMADNVELSRTFIPLEKIRRIRLVANKIHLLIVLTPMTQYEALLSGDQFQMQALVKVIVQRRSLKKKLLRKEWFEPKE